MIPDTQKYNAGRIARGIGISRQAVYSRMAATGPWRLLDLPTDWQEEIVYRAVKRGFENGDSFLCSLADAWVCPLPWDRVPKREQQKAIRLQKALGQALALRADPKVSAGDAELAGLADFKAEFGYGISARHWRRLLHRTLERDGGEENWQRLDIYLDDRAFVTPKHSREIIQNEFAHRALDDAFAAMPKEDLSDDDRMFLWDQVFWHYEALTDGLIDSPKANRRRRAVKASLISYLFKAFPERTICASEGSLKRRFDEKLTQWRNGGRKPEALKSKRDGSWRVAKKLCPVCRELYKRQVYEDDGNWALAWRKLHSEGQKQFCTTCATGWKFDVRSRKSYVPKNVVRDLEAEVQSALREKPGKKHSRLISPCTRRDWSDTGPGDCTVYDDATPDHAIYGEVELPLAYSDDPRFGLFVGRMEVLFAFDERTDYPKAYEIILGEPGTVENPRKEKARYNMVHQRLVMIREHDRIGLPHKWFKLENGPWRNRFNDGEKVPYWENIGFINFANGLSNATGKTVRHTTPGNPRSKIVERIFGVVWDRMKCFPGHVGKNERLDRREGVQDFLGRVKAGKEHPGNGLLSVSQYRQVLDQELMAFAKEPQNGDRLPGVAPEEAWLHGIGGHPGILSKPPEKLGDTARWLLSTHERVATVNANVENAKGIVLKFSRTPYYFWGPELEPYQNQHVLCRFHFDQPDVLCCKAADGNLFTIQAVVTKANTESREKLEQIARNRASWMRRGKVTFDNLPHQAVTNLVRDNQHSEEVHEFGRFQNDAMAQHQMEKRIEEREMRKMRRRAAVLGASVPDKPRNPAAVSEALADEQEILNRSAQRSAEGSTSESE